MEEATRVCKDYFSDRGEEVDNYFFSPMVRYLTKRSLALLGFTARYDVLDFNEATPHLEVLANNGLEIKFEGYCFRLLKTGGGELPVPGPSQKKQEFYRQLPLPLGWPTTESEEAYPNRIIMWQVDGEHKLVQLYLAAPKAGQTSKESVDAYYLVPIPYPTEIFEPQENGTVDHIDDIEVTLKETGLTDDQDSEIPAEEVETENEDDLR